jgi:hypothetical protein
MVVLLLMGMFVLLSTGVLALGISVYNNTTDVSSENYTHRTALSYIANQVRRGDGGGSIRVADLGGAEALTFRETIGGVPYLTSLYCYDGQLRELFTEEGVQQEIASGVVIMPLAGLDFAEGGGSVKVTATDGAGRSRSLLLTPRSGMSGAGAPAAGTSGGGS